MDSKEDVVLDQKAGDEPKCEEHPEGSAIRRQVEYYFSDQNLPHDAYLLMMIGTENLPVSLKTICGFSKMRKFKPYSAVRESLRKSTFLEIVNNNSIKRRVALSIKPVVDEKKIEEVRMEEQKKKVLDPDQPWLTKGMLKPTGFEQYFAEAPVTPQVFKEEQLLYDMEISFETRIETAIQRFRARRKFHQQDAQTFDKFMRYGGIDAGPKPFGGNDMNDLADKDAAEIAALTAQHFVSDHVISTDKWDIDFAAVLKGFLSCHILDRGILDTDNAQTHVPKITNVIRNFYNYLLHHNVCPEYEGQIYAALKVCDLANLELPNVVKVIAKLPGPFNSAVSALHEGLSAGVYTDDVSSWEGADPDSLTLENCRDMVKFALSAHGSEQQYKKVSEVGNFKTVYKEQVSLEVSDIEMPDEETRELYAKARESKPFLSTLGKLHCHRWNYEFAPSFDHSEEALERQERGESIVLWLEEETLRYCFAGMKIQGEIRELDIGIQWLDSVRSVGPSFFKWLPNELHGEERARKAVEEATQQLKLT